MIPRIFIAVGTVAMLVAGCSDSGSPATAPSLPASTSTTATVTTAAPTTTTNTTAMVTTTATEPPSTTTTLDRVAEIEAIIRDLYVRWGNAIASGDEEALRSLYFEAGLADIEASFATTPPLPLAAEPLPPSARLANVVRDTALCLVIDAIVDASGMFSAPVDPTAVRVVLERSDTEAEFLFSYRGEGYECDGEHPLA